jgi:hypothetical protein
LRFGLNRKPDDRDHDEGRHASPDHGIFPQTVMTRAMREHSRNIGEYWAIARLLGRPAAASG